MTDDIDLVGLCNLLQKQVKETLDNSYQENINFLLIKLNLINADDDELLCWLRCNDNSLLKGVVFSETGKILGETECVSQKNSHCTWKITKSWSGLNTGTKFQAPLTAVCLDSVLSENCWHVTTMHLLGIDGGDNALFS